MSDYKANLRRHQEKQQEKKKQLLKYLKQANRQRYFNVMSFNTYVDIGST